MMASLTRVAFMRPTLTQQRIELDRELLALERWYRETPDELREYYNRRKPALQEEIRQLRKMMEE